MEGSAWPSAGTGQPPVYVHSQVIMEATQRTYVCQAPDTSVTSMEAGQPDGNTPLLGAGGIFYEGLIKVTWHDALVHVSPSLFSVSPWRA